MKRISIILAVSAIVLAFASCDKIEEPYIKDVVVTGDRVVFLEDYTGVKCINCPEAAEIAHELLENYPSNLVVVSVHAGFLSVPLPGSPDFRTEAGTTWYDAFDLHTNPIGTINRMKKADGSYGYNSDAWGTKIDEEVQKDMSAYFDLIPSYDETTRTLDVTLRGEFAQELTGDFYIFAGIMEDSIQAKQLTPNGMNNNYWHRHVFRTPINGIWGEPFFKGLTEVEQPIYKRFSITIDTTYNEDQCYVFAYIYDNALEGEILQAGQAKIK